MTIRDILTTLMGEKQITNAELARRLNVSQATIWDRLNSKKTNNMTVAKFDDMLNQMGYKVAVLPMDTDVDGLNGFEVEKVE